MADSVIGRLKGRHRDGILRKTERNRPLRQSEKRFNKLISKRRFQVPGERSAISPMYQPGKDLCNQPIEVALTPVLHRK